MLWSMFTCAAEWQAYRCFIAMFSIINPYDTKGSLCWWREHVLSVKQNVKVSLCLYTWQNHIMSFNLTVKKIIGLMFSTGIAWRLRKWIRSIGEVLQFKQNNLFSTITLCGIWTLKNNWLYHSGPGTYYSNIYQISGCVNSTNFCVLRQDKTS